MAVGEYERIEDARRAAWRRVRHALHHGTDAERETAGRVLADLTERRARYLRDLLARLPFRWHVAHAYTPQETASYGGADHVVVDEPVRVGRLAREAGDALSRPRRRFWGLHEVEEGRLPTSLADIRIAERIVDPPRVVPGAGPGPRGTRGRAPRPARSVVGSGEMATTPRGRTARLDQDVREYLDAPGPGAVDDPEWDVYLAGSEDSVRVRAPSGAQAIRRGAGRFQAYAGEWMEVHARPADRSQPPVRDIVRIPRQGQ